VTGVVLANIEEWVFPFGFFFGIPIIFVVISIVVVFLNIRREKPGPPFGEPPTGPGLKGQPLQ
jgi:hypothetical protein